MWVFHAILKILDCMMMVTIETAKNFCKISRNSNRVDLGLRETLFSILLGVVKDIFTTTSSLERIYEL